MLLNRNHPKKAGGCRYRRLALAVLMVWIMAGLGASRATARPLLESAQAPAAQASSQRAKAQEAFPPAIREKATRYNRARYRIYFGGVALDIVIYFLLWWLGFGVWLRNLAARASHRRIIQCLIFVPVFWILVALIGSPLDYYSGFVVERRFHLSTESFPMWLGDWGKMLGLTVAAAIIAVWILYGVIRRSSRRWWLWFWLITLPLVFLLMFGEPYIIEPMFFRYTPLVKTEPVLTSRIEQMLGRAGVTIPPSRILLMNASSKTRALNAYVSGIGRSKRVVVWDTTLQAMTPDEVLTVVAHETGHYVLHHVPKEFVLDEIVALGAFFLGFILVTWSAGRWGARTRIGSTEDLASLPLLMLILTIVVFLASPLYCGVSRHYEHQADKYGLELAYGSVPNPNAAMIGAFQVIARVDLADPDPNPFIRVWLFTHPPLDARIRFAADYHPWTEGKPMKLLHR